MKESLIDKCHRYIQHPVAPLGTFLIGLILGGLLFS